MDLEHDLGRVKQTMGSPTLANLEQYCRFLDSMGWPTVPRRPKIYTEPFEL